MNELHPEKNTPLWRLQFEGAWPMAVAFWGSNQKLVAANQDGAIFVWDLPAEPPAPTETPKGQEPGPPSHLPSRRLDGHTNGVTRLLVTPDGKTLISASLDHSIRLWPAGAPAAGKTQVVLDRDSRAAQARRTGKKDQIDAPGIEVETQTECQVLSGHQDWIQALGLSRDGKRLISGDNSAVSIVWDLSARKEVARIPAKAWNWIVAAALSPDGQTALVSEYRYKRDDFDIPAAGLKLWDLAGPTLKHDLLLNQFPKLKENETSYGSAQLWRKFVGNGLIAADYSPDGKLVALGQGGETDTGKVHLIDTATGKVVREVSGHQYGVTDVLFSADGKFLLSTGRDTCLRICKVEDGKEVAVLHSPRGGQFKDWLSAVALSPDQTHLAAADIAGKVHVWRLGG